VELLDDIKLKGMNSHSKDCMKTTLELTTLYLNSIEFETESELKDSSKPETWTRKHHQNQD